MRAKNRILIADTDRSVLHNFAEYLRENAFCAITTQSTVGALTQLIEARPPIDLFLVDFEIAKAGYWHLIRYIRRTLVITPVQLPIIVFAPILGVDIEMTLMREEINDWLEKPVCPLALLLPKIRALLGLEGATSGQ